jgi:hypothetical protein
VDALWKLSLAYEKKEDWAAVRRTSRDVGSGGPACAFLLGEGAAYAFRSRQHRGEVVDKPIAITGYVVKTNLGRAPRCAVHRGGIADPDNCRAEIASSGAESDPTMGIMDYFERDLLAEAPQLATLAGVTRRRC